MASRTSRSDLRRAVVLLVGCALLAAGCTVGGRHGGRAHAGGSPQTEETRQRAMFRGLLFSASRGCAGSSG
jgi:hypothetical protein